MVIMGTEHDYEQKCICDGGVEVRGRQVRDDGDGGWEFCTFFGTVVSTQKSERGVDIRFS